VAHGPSRAPPLSRTGSVVDDRPAAGGMNGGVRAATLNDINMSFRER
jgi:hypothetical protein